MPIIVDKTSQCDICLQRYRPERVPVILPCGHTLCKDCSKLICRCHLCRSPFEEDQVLRIHVDYERLPAIVAESDNSLGEIDLNTINADDIDADAMTGFPSDAEGQASLESMIAPPVSEQTSSVDPVAASPSCTSSSIDPAITSEVLLVVMEGVLRDSMDQHRRELTRLRRLQARQEEELAMAQALAMTASPPQGLKQL